MRYRKQQRCDFIYFYGQDESVKDGAPFRSLYIFSTILICRLLKLLIPPFLAAKNSAVF
jgi:hypothetical protein